MDEIRTLQGGRQVLHAKRNGRPVPQLPEGFLLAWHVWKYLWPDIFDPLRVHPWVGDPDLAEGTQLSPAWGSVVGEREVETEAWCS